MKKLLFVIMTMAMLFSWLNVSLADGTETAVGDWLVGQYVDDFGDPTGGTFVYTVSSGTFSNTATSESALTVAFYYQQDACKIRLLEYNQTPATYYSNSQITLKYKVDDVIYSHSLYPNDTPNGDILVMDWYENYASMTSGLSPVQQLNFLKKDRPFDKSAYKQITSFLAAGKNVRCVMMIDNSKYSFTISADGFGDAVFGQSYNDAVLLMENGDYTGACEAFSALGEYKDSPEKVNECLSLMYGPLYAQIASLQKEQSLTLNEALAIAEEDGSYKESDASVSLMESLKTLAQCEGTYVLEKDSKYGPYDLDVKYVINGAKIEAQIAPYRGFGGTWTGNGFVHLFEADMAPYTVGIEIYGVNSYTKATMQFEILLNAQDAVLHCVTADWSHAGSRSEFAMNDSSSEAFESKENLVDSDSQTQTVVDGDKNTSEKASSHSYAGTYTGIGKGIGGDVTVTLSLNENGMVIDAKIDASNETSIIGGAAAGEIAARLSDINYPFEVDTVAGATFTSNAILDALSQIRTQIDAK